MTETNDVHVEHMIKALMRRNHLRWPFDQAWALRVLRYGSTEDWKHYDVLMDPWRAGRTLEMFQAALRRLVEVVATSYEEGSEAAEKRFDELWAELTRVDMTWHDGYVDPDGFIEPQRFAAIILEYKLPLDWALASLSDEELYATYRYVKSLLVSRAGVGHASDNGISFDDIDEAFRPPTPARKHFSQKTLEVMAAVLAVSQTAPSL